MKKKNNLKKKKSSDRGGLSIDSNVSLYSTTQVYFISEVPKAKKRPPAPVKSVTKYLFFQSLSKCKLLII